MQGSSHMLSMSIVNAAWPITAAAFDVIRSKLCWTYNKTFIIKVQVCILDEVPCLSMVVAFTLFYKPQSTEQMLCGWLTCPMMVLNLSLGDWNSLLRFSMIDGSPSCFAPSTIDIIPVSILKTRTQSWPNSFMIAGRLI